MAGNRSVLQARLLRIRREKMIECWKYKCKCGHTNYFMVGGAQDIICHRCYNYGMKYLGREMVTKDEYNLAQKGGSDECK